MDKINDDWIIGGMTADRCLLPLPQRQDLEQRLENTKQALRAQLIAHGRMEEAHQVRTMIHI